MKNQNVKADLGEFVAYLQTSSYKNLFLLGSNSKSDSLWELDTSGTIFRVIIEADSFDNRTRFFAAEVLFEHSNWRPTGALKMKAALIYAEALQKNYTFIANPWGLPDDLGRIGRHVILFGDTALIAFYPLLKCGIGLEYAGSKVATTGKIYRYRVKDVAATYIAHILGMEFNAERSPWIRNFSIRKIRRAAGKRI